MWQVVLQGFPIALGSSHLIVSGGLHNFFSVTGLPSHFYKSVIGKVRKGMKPSKAQIYDMKCASCHTIAYASIQVRFLYRFTQPDALQMCFLLSSLSSWSTIDSHFDLHEFFDNIVALFETNPCSLWVIKTLNWWNMYIFPQIFFIDLIFWLVKFCGQKLEVTRRSKHAKTLQSLRIQVMMTFWPKVMLK